MPWALLPPLAACLFLSDEDLAARLGAAAEDGEKPADSATDDTADGRDSGVPDHTGDSSDPADTGDSSGGGDSGDSGCATDADGDGYVAASCGGPDCDDGDGGVHPGAGEDCDGVDDDCDGSDQLLDAVEFDATTDAVSFPDASALELGVSWTIEMWIYPTAESGGLYTKGTGTSPLTTVEMIYFGLSSGKPYAYFANGSAGASSLVASSTVIAGTWNHVAWVADDDVLTIYLDGTSSGATNTETDATDGSGTASLGSHTALSAAAVTGYVSDVRVSNYARYTSGFSPDSALSADMGSMAFWPLDDARGATAADEAGGDDGTLGGATWVEAPCRP